MQQQKLCLKWNNHTINLLSVLETFQQKDILVDVTLSCEGRNIKAHKMVLSACSPYFQHIFLENPCQHPIVIINGMKYDDIMAILNFMYKGEVNVSHEGLSSFLQAAEALKVKGLAEVCGGEKKSTNLNSQDADQGESSRPQADTPTKKRHRNRKRSFDSTRSDDEGAPRKHKELPNSPEIHELSGDESFTGDMSSNGQQINSLPRVPQNVYSRSHQSSSNLGGEEIEDDYEVEPSKLLEQTLTTESVSMNNSGSSDNSLRIERIRGNATEMESSSLQEPESPPDIKPIIEYGESSAGPPEGSMLVYNEQSQPGPSNLQDGSLLHDNSHTQGRLFSVTNVVSLSKKRRSKHTCETAQLLQDIRGDHDALCMCQLSNTDFEKDSDENGFNMSAQRENIKSHNRSKQLLIYKEKDCIKGIEMNNELNSNDPSTPYEFQATAYLPSENIDVSLGERFLNDEQDHLDLSSNSPMQNISQNFKFVCPPSFNNNTTSSDIDSNRRLNVALVSQSYPQYSVNTVKENILPRKRGNKPKSVWEKTHNAFNKTTSSAVNGSEPTVPCTLLGKQSYTQVSVEEVHVAETSRTRRRRKKKRARETLMLKRKIQRKIVQSTSFEYQSGSIKKGHTTNMDAEFSVDHSASKQHSGQLTKFNNELSLIRRTRRVFDPSVPEKYGPELLPPGWNTQIVTRKSGKTAGLIDIYFISPDGNRLRSRVEVASYIEKNGLPYLPEEFCFRRSAYKHPKC